MKHLKTATTILGCFASAYHLISAVDARIHLESLNDHIYIAEDGFFAKENSLIYIGFEYITIVGATWTPQTAELLHQQIQTVTNKPVGIVINTNYHPDRAGGNDYWAKIGSEIHATRQTDALMRSEWQTICDWTHQKIQSFPGSIPAIYPTHLHDGSFSLEGGKIEVLYLGPSHTPDGVFVYFPEDKLLYGGCILKSFLGNLEHADLEAYPLTLERLKQLNLPIDTIIAGHGEAIQPPDLVDHYQELLNHHLEKPKPD